MNLVTDIIKVRNKDDKSALLHFITNGQNYVAIYINISRNPKSILSLTPLDYC